MYKGLIQGGTLVGTCTTTPAGCFTLGVNPAAVLPIWKGASVGEPIDSITGSTLASIIFFSNLAHLELGASDEAGVQAPQRDSCQPTQPCAASLYLPGVAVTSEVATSEQELAPNIPVILCRPAD